MKILVVGNGGREHAILDKLRRDAPDAELFVTVGNGGTAGLAEAIPIKPTEIQPLAGWAANEGIDLTIVGPEIPLAEGIVDHFSSRDLPIFGPTRAAAELESSKAFAKSLMARYDIPTASFEVFTDLDSALAYVERVGGPIVVKASGLAAGKGAIVCADTGAALDAVREIFGDGKFGAAGDRVVIEEFMRGEELSVFAICDGHAAHILMAAQDHKQIGEGDTGPNTGGMGAYAPVSIATPDLLAEVQRQVLDPTMAAMAAENRPYRGIMYAGLMITETGPRVVEFNCRFGDPETQVILPLLESSLIDLALTVARGERIGEDLEVRLRPGAAVTTVLASGGYPGDYDKGFPIDIPASLQDEERVTVFHAGTAIKDGELVTAGGRVLAVTATAASVPEAAQASLAAAERIEFQGRTLRRDIGWREIARV